MEVMSSATPQPKFNLDLDVEAQDVIDTSVALVDCASWLAYGGHVIRNTSTYVQIGANSLERRVQLASVLRLIDCTSWFEAACDPLV